MLAADDVDVKAANRNSLANRDTFSLFDKLRNASAQHESVAIPSRVNIPKLLRKKHRNGKKIQHNVHVLSEEKLTENNKDFQKVTVDENQKRDQCKGLCVIVNQTSEGLQNTRKYTRHKDKQSLRRDSEGTYEISMPNKTISQNPDSVSDFTNNKEIKERGKEMLARGLQRSKLSGQETGLPNFNQKAIVENASDALGNSANFKPKALGGDDDKRRAQWGVKDPKLSIKSYSVGRKNSSYLSPIPAIKGGGDSYDIISDSYLRTNRPAEETFETLKGLQDSFFYSNNLQESFSAQHSNPRTSPIDSPFISHINKHLEDAQGFNLPVLLSHSPSEPHSSHYPSRFGPPTSTPLPSFDTTTPSNISAQHGSNVFLLCKIRNLANQSVSNNVNSAMAWLYFCLEWLFTG